MYFLQQIKSQFISHICAYQEMAEGPRDVPEPVAGTEKSDLPTDPVEAAKALQKKAQGVTGSIDAAVQREEERGLSEKGEKMGGKLQESLKSYSVGELPMEEREEINELFTKAGLEGIPEEISIDAMEDGELDNIGTEATPEEIEQSAANIQGELKNIDEQIANLPQGAQREVLEQKQSLLGTILNIIEGKTEGGIGGMGFAGVESNGSHNVVSTAKKHLGIKEATGQADKFLMGMARSARETPWCAGFVSYVCKEAGYNITPTLSSKAFIGESGKGHVAFNIGGGKMLGGNQSDQVSIKNINKPVAGWIMPEDYAAGKPAQKSGNAPVGAILVFNRGSQRNLA